MARGPQIGKHLPAGRYQQLISMIKSMPTGSEILRLKAADFHNNFSVVHFLSLL